MAGYRQIHTKIWSDNWFLDLDPQEKLLFIYLFGNDKTSVSGFYEFSLKLASFETGLDQGFINDTLAVFEAAGKVIVDGAYVWVKNLRKYNESKSPNVRKRILSDLEDLPDGVIKARYQSEYGLPSNGKPLTDPLPTPTKPLREHEHEHEKEQNNNINVMINEIGEMAGTMNTDYYKDFEELFELYDHKDVMGAAEWAFKRKKLNIMTGSQAMWSALKKGWNRESTNKQREEQWSEIH